MTNQNIVISTNNLYAQYGHDIILDNISFEVKKGQIFMVVGASGSGKSTLLNHMIGLITPAAGNIFILGKDITCTEGKDRLDILKNIGVTYQSGALFGSMTLLENVCVPLEEWTCLPKTALKRIGLNKLREVGLERYANHLPAQISGGMQKRAGIARAMALDPQIIFLDEPSAGLDPITSADLDNLILSLSQTLNTTFVIVSHELRSILNIADNVIVLHKKKIIASGPPEILKHSEEQFVRQFFNATPNCKQ